MELNKSPNAIYKTIFQPVVCRRSWTFYYLINNTLFPIQDILSPHKSGAMMPMTSWLPRMEGYRNRWGCLVSITPNSRRLKTSYGPIFSPAFTSQPRNPSTRPYLCLHVALLPYITTCHGFSHLSALGELTRCLSRPWTLPQRTWWSSSTNNILKQ